MTNRYSAAFEPLRASHDDLPTLGRSERKTLPVGVGRYYPKGVPQEKLAQSYEASAHLIDSEGQPVVPTRVENNPSRRRLLAAGLAAVVLAASGAAAYVGVKAAEPGTAPGPDVAPLVHHIQDNENNHDPIQNPTPVTAAELKAAGASSNGP